jgi:hypothetical protein
MQFNVVNAMRLPDTNLAPFTGGADLMTACDLTTGSQSGLACDDLLKEFRSDGIRAHKRAAISGNEQHG